MHKLGLYWRLACQSQRSNRQFYLPFALTASGCGAMFYIMRFLCYSELSQNVRYGSYLLFILVLGCIVIGYTALCVLWYANKFVMRRRRRELGLYNILGLQKGDVACVLGLETAMLALGSIAGGLLGGLLFSYFSLLLLARLVRFAAPFHFFLSVPGMAQTAALMGVIFAVLFLYNLVTIARSRPVELLHSTNVGEREPKSRRILAALGVLCLGGGYTVAVLSRTPVQAFAMFFPAVMLVIAGTHLLFVAGSVVILKALRKNKAFYYRPQNFTAVSGMLYRMRQNAKGLANICILATMVLVTVSCTVCLYCGAEGALRTLYPSEISLHYVCPAEEIASADFMPLTQAVGSAAVENGCAEGDTKGYLRVAFPVSRSGSTYTIAENFGAGTGMSVTCITAADYARLTGTETSLQAGQALGWGIPAGDLQLGSLSFHVLRELADFPVASDAFSGVLSAHGCLVVADRAALREIYDAQAAALGSNASSAVYCLFTDSAFAGDAASLQCFSAMQVASDAFLSANPSGIQSVTADCRAAVRSDYYISFGGFLFLGLFLGLLFSLATVLIIYYKQLSEGYEDRDRFVILQKVGMSEAEVHTTIRRQVLMIFFLPLAMAAVHVAFAFPMILRLFTLFALTDVKLLLLCTVGTYAVFSVVYILVYLATARKYYQIVRA